MSTLPRLEEWKAHLVAYREARAKELHAALVATQGNIKHAALKMAPPISRQRATVLVKELGLVDFARELRRASGIRGATATGRPPPEKTQK